MKSLLSFLSREEEFENLGQHEFENKLKSSNENILIDVRTPMEHNQFALPESLLLDISTPEFAEKIETFDKAKSYFLYCHSGSRSYVAAKHMIKLGFTNVFNLKQGVSRWRVS